MACRGFAREIVSGSPERHGNKRTVLDRNPIVGAWYSLLAGATGNATLEVVDSVDERSANAIIKH